MQQGEKELKVAIYDAEKRVSRKIFDKMMDIHYQHPQPLSTPTKKEKRLMKTITNQLHQLSKTQEKQ